MKNSKLNWQRAHDENLIQTRGSEPCVSERAKLHLTSIKCSHCESELDNNGTQPLERHLRTCAHYKEFCRERTLKNDPHHVRKNAYSLRDLKALEGFPKSAIGKLVKIKTFLGAVAGVVDEGKRIHVMNNEGEVRIFQLPE